MPQCKWVCSRGCLLLYSLYKLYGVAAPGLLSWLLPGKNTRRGGRTNHAHGRCGGMVCDKNHEGRRQASCFKIAATSSAHKGGRGLSIHILGSPFGCLHLRSSRSGGRLRADTAASVPCPCC